GNLEPVFKTILTSATRLCGAKFGILWLREADALRAVAFHGAPRPYVEERRRNPLVRPNPKTMLGRAAATKRPAQIADLRTERGPRNAPPGATGAQLARLGGARTVLAVPMVKENELVGVIGIYRQEIRPFTAKQVELVAGFAAQAVIAIENTRLLSELREALEQQTATSDVLGVISSSPGELKPVFRAVLENATRLCEAKFGPLTLFDGDELRVAAVHGAPRAFEELRRRDPIVPGVVRRRMERRRIWRSADLAADKRYAGSPLVTLAGARSHVSVPLLRDNKQIGNLSIYRQEGRPFTDNQIELLTRLAAHAGIAIENQRVLNELREALAQQTATSEVLGVISSSPGELEPVFSAMLENATRICEAKFGNISLFKGDELHVVAMHGAPGAYEQLRQRDPRVPGVVRRRVAAKQALHIADIAADKRYASTPLVKLGGARSFVGVPLLRDSRPIGELNVFRQEVRPFTDKQITLLTNFAAQAVIAIENARLLNELRESLQQQTATSQVLQVVSSSPGELAPVFTAMLENAVRICEAK